jgi:hypothetical protein
VLGTRAGNWLTRAQAEKLLSLPDIETLKGKARPRAPGIVCERRSAARIGDLIKTPESAAGRTLVSGGSGRKGRTRADGSHPDWTQQAVALWLEAMPIKEVQSRAVLVQTLRADKMD